MKKLMILALLLAAGAGGWWYWRDGRNGTPDYVTQGLAKGPITQVVTATGSLNPVINVQVGSQISGNIQKLFADFNSPVKAGQVVAQLDPSIYQAIVHQTEGEVANARAALDLAQITAKRKEELVEQKAAAPADLDNARAALRQAEAFLQVRMANLEKARVDLDHCTIYSPIDGTVISRNVDVGQTVAATMNAPVLFTVANDLTKMQIDSNVAEADVGSVEVGQEVEFTVDAFPSRTFHGKVEQVRNAATTVQNVVTYDVVVSVANDDLKLKPGMTANVSVIVAHRDEALKLPNAALRFRPPEAPGKTTAASSPTPKPGGGRPSGSAGRAKTEREVYVLPAGAAEPKAVQVKLGLSDGIHTEVLEGLQEGDEVVTGMNAPQTASAPQRPSNPLGGGPRFR
jgi:HlyD family secretion protein